MPIHVFGPETHMTAIVGMALGKREIPPPAKRQSTTANFLLPDGQVSDDNSKYKTLHFDERLNIGLIKWHGLYLIVGLAQRKHIYGPFHSAPHHIAFSII